MGKTDGVHLDRYSLVDVFPISFRHIAKEREDFEKTPDMTSRLLSKNEIALVCTFETKETGTRLVIANVHLHWNPRLPDVKLVQAALMVDEIDKIVNRFATQTAGEIDKIVNRQTAREKPAPVYTDGYKIPLIICGDFNSIPDSGVYKYLSTGSIPPNHPDFGSYTYGTYTSEGTKHYLGLKSAYSLMENPPMTIYTPRFRGVIDYIWFSTQNLSVNAVLGGVDKQYLDRVVGFPDDHFPSE